MGHMTYFDHMIKLESGRIHKQGGLAQRLE